jgi:hypothetical protein
MNKTSAEKAKAYRLRHPDRVRESKHKHYIANKSRINTLRNARYKANKEKENERSKEWYARNKEYRKEYTRRYRQSKRVLFKWYKDFERFGGIKETILERDNHKCIGCFGLTRLDIHHIDGSGKTKSNPKRISNNNPNNLVTLCWSCHGYLHAIERKRGIDIKNFSIDDIVRTLRKRKEAGSKSQR